MPSAIDVLRSHGADFVDFKRAGGVGFVKQEKILNRFLNHCEDFVGNECVLSKEAVLSWCELGNNESRNNQRVRVITARAFAEYLNKRGVFAYISEPFRYGETEFKPYIFTDEELSKFFTASDHCLRNNQFPYRSYVMPIIFRLIYSCGLRLSEAVNLRVKDVDLESGILTVLNTKFGKDRQIPMHTEMTKLLRKYVSQVLPFADKDSAFFPNNTRDFYNPASIYHAFRGILWSAGISHGGKGIGPRVHDFRHTFAVHCLRKWVIDGQDLSTALLYLSAYMGHDGIYHTQVYLRLTAQMYPNIVNMMEQKFDVLPECGGAYEAD